MISLLIKPDPGRRDSEMFAIESTIRSARQERHWCAEGLPHQIVDRFGEPEPFAAILISKDYWRRPRLFDLNGKHENRRTILVAPPHEWCGESGRVEGALRDQGPNSYAVAEQASAEGCQDALHGTEL